MLTHSYSEYATVN